MLNNTTMYGANAATLCTNTVKKFAFPDNRSAIQAIAAMAANDAPAILTIE